MRAGGFPVIGQARGVQVTTRCQSGRATVALVSSHLPRRASLPAWTRADLRQQPPALTCHGLAQELQQYTASLITVAAEIRLSAQLL